MNLQSMPMSDEHRRAHALTTASILAVVAVFALLAWHRRWIADDGLIVVRTVRNILAGNGPVFNAFERAESNTSALWPWLLAAVCNQTGRDPVQVTVVTGWVLAIAAVAIAMDATRRWHRAHGCQSGLVPAGALVVVGCVPFWDFATSGLETSLCWFWIACVWWLVTALRSGSSGQFQYATAAAIGLGPLVRPDFGLISAVFFTALCVVVRPSRRRLLGLGAVAAVLPMGYEVFRAGYYGTLVPLPALAKSAGNAEWNRGIRYLVDFIRPCWVWLPMAGLSALGILAWAKSLIPKHTWVPIAASLASAALLTLFVVRVGGDFMHARMLLPPTFAAVLPAMVLPWRPLTRPFVIGLVGWAVVAGVYRGRGKAMATAHRVADERAGYVRWTKTSNPVTGEVFIAAEGPAAERAANALRDHNHVLITESGIVERANPEYVQPIIYVAGRLGTGGIVTPLDGFVVDTLGLANPLGARIAVNQPGMTGHEKALPWSWIRAGYADPADDINQPEAARAEIGAARRAMKCGALAELIASTRAPLTPQRFWSNVIGALDRTRLEIPTDPHAAEAKFCSPP